MERAGIPTVTVTPMPNVALNVGANRILVGVGITHPLGDPALDPGPEAQLRRRLVERALEMLTAEATGQMVVTCDAGAG